MSDRSLEDLNELILLPDENVDELNRVVIDSKRNDPPLGDETVRIELIKMEKGVMWFGGVRNEDPNTRRRMKFGDEEIEFSHYGLIGGRAKAEGGETLLDTAREELYEEAGVLSAITEQRIEGDELGIVSRVVWLNTPLRDSKDEKIMDEKEINGRQVIFQKRGELSNIVLAHVGDLHLRETTDKEARDPRWITLSEMLQNFQKYSEIQIRLRNGGLSSSEVLRMKEEFIALDKNGIYSFSHIVLRLLMLKYIRAGYRSYITKKAEGVPQDDWDKRFFYSVSAPARESKDNLWAFRDFIERGMIDDGIVLDRGPEDDTDIANILKFIACDELAKELGEKSEWFSWRNTNAYMTSSIRHEPWGAEQHFVN